MSWLKVDDGFAENAKVLLLSDAALMLWMRCACWARKRENQHTRGFVPAALLPAISRLPAPKAKRLAQELVAADAGGTKDHGLWETRDGGWQFHDWEEYLPPEEKLSPQEAARVAGRRSAEVRKLRNGTAQPAKPRTASNDSEPFEERSAVRSTERPPSNDDRTSRTPDPVPDPVPKPETTTAMVRGGLVPCPPDLELDPQQRAQLGMAIGITNDAIDRWTPVLRASFVTQSARTLEQWRRSLSTGLRRSWDTERDAMLGKAPPPRAVRGRGSSQPNSGLSIGELFDQLPEATHDQPA